MDDAPLRAGRALGFGVGEAVGVGAGLDDPPANVSRSMIAESRRSVKVPGPPPYRPMFTVAGPTGLLDAYLAAVGSVSDALVDRSLLPPPAPQLLLTATAERRRPNQLGS